VHEEPDLSVIVPTYARAGSVRELLDALSLQTLAPDRFEVVIAVDGSRDGTLELVDGYSAPYQLWSIWQENSGRASARNAAIRRACAPVVLMLDDDVEPAPECLEAHLDAHRHGPSRGVLGAAPFELRPGDAPVARYFKEKFDAHLARLAEADHSFSARDVYSCNLSLERRLLLEAGLFDERFTRYGNEDVDLALRLRSAGAEFVYESRALARQHFVKDLLGAMRDEEAKGETALLLARKSPSAVPELRLGTYKQASLRWRMLRRLVLSPSRRSRVVPDMLTRVTLLLERSGRPLPRRYYEFLFDLSFWHGVERGLADLDTDERANAGRLLLH
jgi:glycosyltransferase involved in cell wall biosynthesis